MPTSLKARRSDRAVASDGVEAQKNREKSERTCFVTRASLSRTELIRFAVAPSGEVVFDLSEKLPGRGAWVVSKRAAVDKAVEKALFSRAFGQRAVAPPDLANRIEAALVKRCLEGLGLARRAGDLVLGFDNVTAALKAETPPLLLIEAMDGAFHGRDRLLRIAAHAAAAPLVLGCFLSGELNLALGRENVIHGALKPSGCAKRVLRDATRLSGFRPIAPEEWSVDGRGNAREPIESEC